MQLVIMRHGDAEHRGNDRVLSDFGRREAELTASYLKDCVKPSVILSSPKQRAFATACIVRDILCPEVEIVQLTSLLPSGEPENVYDEINDLGLYEEETVLLTSHLPLVSYLSEYFISRESSVPDFVTAGALLLNLKGGKGSKVAFFSPTGVEKY